MLARADFLAVRTGRNVDCRRLRRASRINGVLDGSEGSARASVAGIVSAQADVEVRRRLNVLEVNVPRDGTDRYYSLTIMSREILVVFLNRDVIAVNRLNPGDVP